MADPSLFDRFSSNWPTWLVTIVRQGLGVTALLAAVALVVASVSLGWYLMWVVALHKVKLVREILGIQKKQRKFPREQVEAEIMEIKRLSSSYRRRSTQPSSGSDVRT